MERIVSVLEKEVGGKKRGKKERPSQKALSHTGAQPASGDQLINVLSTKHPRIRIWIDKKWEVKPFMAAYQC